MLKEIPLLIVGDSVTVETDCDCACSTAPFQLYPEHVTSTYYQIVSDIYYEKLTEEFWLAFSPFSPSGPCVMNNAARQRLQQFEQLPQALAAPIDQEFLTQNLIMPVGQKIQMSQEQVHSLVVWLHITNACNLDCPYCYVRKSSARMTEEIGKDAIDKIVEAILAGGFRRLKLKYAGGEALLHFRLIQILHEYVQQRLADTNVELHEVVLSNGVFISSRVADWFAVTGVRLMISLDGVEGDHNRQRPMKSGGNTFSFIEKNIDGILLKKGIIPHISVTVTGLNANGIAQTVAWIQSRELPFTINFYRENSASSDYKALQIEEAAIITGLRDAYRVIEHHLPTWSLMNGLLDKMNTQAHTHTCGVGQNYLVINHEGHLTQCQMHVNDPYTQQDTDIRKLSASKIIPLIANGPIKNISVDEKSGCRDCSFRYRCAGGCPIETYRAVGRWDVQSPNCNIYTTLYPEVLRLEGLRLLKFHGYL